MKAESQNFYLAVPKDGKGPGVLVLHAWWGLNDFFKGFCERLANEGFVALAPDLYHGQTAKTIEQAEQLRSKVPQKQIKEDVLAALDQLQANPAVTSRAMAVIGFSLGGYHALWLSVERPQLVKAVTVFYASRNLDYLHAKAAYLGHFAETDEYESAASVKKMGNSLRNSGHQIEFHTYPGTGHWFFEGDRKDAYDPKAAQLAWERTLAFLRFQFNIERKY